MCGCVVRYGRGARKPLVSAHGGVLMAFAMALNREDDCKEIYARIQPLASVLQDASLDCELCRGGFRGRAVPHNTNQRLCEALPAGTEPSSSAEALRTA